MPRPLITFGTRKALEVHLGEEAGREVAAVLQRMAEALATLERRKVDVTPIVSGNPTGVRSILNLLVPEE